MDDTQENRDCQVSTEWNIDDQVLLLRLIIQNAKLIIFQDINHTIESFPIFLATDVFRVQLHFSQEQNTKA